MTTIEDSHIADNSATDNGGGLYLVFGVPDVIRSTISGNTSGNSGGGIYADSASATISLSTLSGNTASFSGGGVYAADSSVFLDQSTLTLNTADVGGGAATGGSGPFFQTNESIIAQNDAISSDPDVSGEFSQAGPMLIGDVGSAFDFFSGPLIGGNGSPVIDALLLPLDFYGGFTPTHALSPESPAVDAGNTGGGPPADQRGVPRGIDGNDDGVTVNDLGAAELFRILIDNDVTPGDVGAFSMDLLPGGYSGLRDAGLANGAFINADRGEATGLGRSGVVSRSVFEESTYVSIGGSVFSLASTLTSTQALVGEDTVISRGSFSGPSGLIEWTVQSTITDGEPLIQRRIQFDTFDDLDGLQLIHYLEPTFSSPPGELFYVTGTAAGDDLRVFLLDDVERLGYSLEGEYVSGGDLINATFDGFTADNAFDLRDDVITGAASFAPDGVINLPPISDPELGDAYGPAFAATAFAWSTDPSVTQANITTYTSFTIDSTSTFSGTKFEDLNADGIRDPGEPGLEGFVIELDVNDDGVVDFSQATDINGDYSFVNVPPGFHSLQEVVPPGWIQTAPIGGSYFVPIPFGGSASGLDFGNTPILATLSGLKFEDINGNGLLDSGEPGLPDFTIELDLNNDGSVDQTTTTLSDGSYAFLNVRPGQHRLTEIVPPGWIQTAPSSGEYIVDQIGSDVSGLDFGNQQILVTLSGLKFEDINGNGLLDSGEPGLPGFTIELDLNNDGSVDQTTTTLSDGSYSFADVPPGQHRLTEVVPPGWIQTAPSGGEYIVDPMGSDISGLDFGNQPILVTLSGLKFEDVNGNGLLDSGEPGLPGFTIELDLNNDGSVDQTTTTLSDGSYSFRAVRPGQHRLTEIVPPGWIQTAPSGGQYIVDQIGSDIGGLDFGNQPILATLSGLKFEDINGNGLLDSGEPGLPGFTIELDLNNDGSVDQTTTTLSDGSYAFLNVRPGQHRLTEIVPPGWIQTAPSGGQYIVDQIGSDIANLDFGNQRVLFEIGGLVYEDFNRNGMFDLGFESGVGGIVISVDVNNDGSVDDSTTSDDLEGAYSFNLPNGEHRLIVSLMPGFVTIEPASGELVVSVNGAPSNAYDFGILQLAVLSGLKFEDLNRNGQRDSGEDGLPGFEITLEGSLGTQYSTTTASDGSYSVDVLPNETYVIREVQQVGYRRTTPDAGEYLASPLPGELISGLIFGNYRLDGVQSDPYATNGISSDAIGADLNGDGVTDLLVLNDWDYLQSESLGGEASLSVFFGRALGGFEPRQTYFLPEYSRPQAIATADFDRDGDLDVAIAALGDYEDSPAGGGVFLLENQQFGLSSPRFIAAGDGPVALAAGDFTGDAIPDLAVVNLRSDDLVLLKGGIDGDAPFGLGLIQTLSVGDSPLDIETFDFNQDGALDVLITTYGGGQVRTFTGGFAGFTPSMTRSDFLQPSDAAVMDLNGDGLAEIAIADRGDESVVLLQSDVVGNPLTVRIEVPGLPSTVAFGDIHGDGVYELIVGDDRHGRLLVYGRQSGGQWVLQESVDLPSFNGLGNGSPRSLWMGDLDGFDGQEVLVSHFAGGATVTGNFVPLSPMMRLSEGEARGFHHFANPLDADHDGTIGVRDVLMVAGHIYRGGAPEVYSDYSPDANGDGQVTTADALKMIQVIIGSRPNSVRPDASTERPLALDAQMIEPLIADARQFWTDAAGEAAGLRLQRVRIEFADLPDNVLAQARGDVVQLDVNAAGRGWFVDQDPHDELGPEDSNRVDLLTVVLHEMGHVLGLDDAFDSDPNSLMHPWLSVGQRRLPESAVDEIVGSW